jgi:eukaryotic-like serine/threonine-protein kinase
MQRPGSNANWKNPEKTVGGYSSGRRIDVGRSGPVNESQIFANCLRFATANEMAAYLDQVCAGNDDLRKQIDALLNANFTNPGFLEQPAGLLTSATEGLLPEAQAPESVPGLNGASPVIGPYKLIEEIGEGGMGTVYMAQQTEPVKRLVALKVIKPGMDSRSVIARFEAERQALALMDHPNIAKVFDAGTTATGRPYFAMELGKGVPLTKYCDDHHLAVKERLKLFIPVCQAIQHAHQKGIIHRDIKASNVLVALFDGEPVPKVIDFGVAKASGLQLTEKTLVTGFGAVVGTLEYMSPEQAELNQLDVDTRSDVYSLGVLLYELLTGTTPLDRKRMQSAAVLEMLRIIREVEPPRPSTRLSTMEDTALVAANRGLEPRKLHGLVRGELDWIVMKALEKDRKRRYETASGLADDVRHYLNNEPVAAGPPSSWYRLRKLAWRNRVAVLAASGVAGALVAGSAVATWQAVRATDAERAALIALGEKELARVNEARQRGIADRNEQTAVARESETEAVLEFVENKVFAAARPEGVDGGLGHSVSLRNAVEAALPFVASSFADQPLIEARLRITLGSSFQYLGDYKIAAEQAQAALAIYTKHRGPDHPDTLTAMHSLALSYVGLKRYADALKLQEQVLTLRRTKLGADHPETLSTMHSLANSLYRLQKNNDALELYEQTLALKKAKLGPDHPETLKTMNGLANAYSAADRPFDCLKLREETLALQKKKLGLDHPDTLISMYNLAIEYQQLGRPSDALKLREQTFSLQRAKLGLDHPSTFLTMSALVLSYRSMQRFAEASKLCEEAIAHTKARWGPDHPQTLDCITSLAWVYADQGRHPEAFNLLKQALLGQRAKTGLNGPDTLERAAQLSQAHVVYGDLLRGQGNYANARSQYEEALAIKPDDMTARSRLFCLALALEQEGKLTEAEARYRDIVRLDSNGWEAHHRLGLVLEDQGKRIDSEAELKQAQQLNPSFADQQRRGLLPQRRFVGHTAFIEEVVFSPDSHKALSCSRDGMVRLWEIDTGKQLQILRGHKNSVKSVVFSHDGRRALTAGADSTVRYWDLESGRELRRLEGHTGIVFSAVLSSNDRRALSCSSDNTLRWWDAETGRPLRIVEVENTIRCVAVSPDNRRGLAGGGGMIGRVWDLESGTELHRLEGHAGPIWHVAISPDGRMGLTGGQDKTILSWNLETGKHIRRFVGHTSDVNNLFFAPDGKKFVSAADDETVRLWDVATGKELRRWKGHTGMIGAVAISPDGRLAMSGGDDTCICLWQMPN